MQNKTIIKALMNNNRKDAIALIKAGADVNAPDESGEFTPLIAACVNGDAEIVQMLLKHGADPNQQAKDGFSPLHFAASKGAADCIKLLLDGGARPDCFNDFGETPLMRAADKGDQQSVLYLIAAGANVNAQSKNDGLTPLMLAADKGHTQVVFVLLQALADPSLTSYALRTAYDYARLKNFKDIMHMLKPEPQQADTDKKFPPANKFNEQIHKELIDAIWGKNLQKVVAAFEKGAWVNPPRGDYDIPLFIAARMGSYEIVKFLIEQGADVNAKDSTDLTPLSQACGGCYADVAQLLLENGAQADANVFMAASVHKHPEIMKLLHKEKLKQGTPKLSQKGSGADLISAAANGNLSLLKKALAQGADVNNKDDEGATALLWASRKGYIDIVRLLLEKDADTNAASEYKWTPIMEAAVTGGLEIVKLLIANKADVNAITNSGAAPIIFASAEGYPEIVSLLLKNGANATVAIQKGQNQGMTAYTFARKNGHYEVLEILKKAGVQAGKIECQSCGYLNEPGKYCKNCGTQIAD